MFDFLHYGKLYQPKEYKKGELVSLSNNNVK